MSTSSQIGISSILLFSFRTGRSFALSRALLPAATDRPNAPRGCPQGLSRMSPKTSTSSNRVDPVRALNHLSRPCSGRSDCEREKARRAGRTTLGRRRFLRARAASSVDRVGRVPRWLFRTPLVAVEA
jgi:hypothetical protein